MNEESLPTFIGIIIGAALLGVIVMGGIVLLAVFSLL